ncbi:hypothetical protein AB0436_26895 [Streptomyces sp. NPDC051322]|uniref:hypothetical protein n=1 Tax=Streptomyces sp. NPDC051322 TaxID=3154645 RepID=UPI00344B044F
MRNPVGPLPSSIYWRRRAVAASLVALLALLVVWIVTSGGGGKHGSSGSKGSGPASSITPGPSGSGPAISQAPGGRDTSSASGGSGGSADSGGSDGAGGSDGTGDGSGSDTGTDTGGTSTAGNAAGGTAGSGAGGTGADAGQRVSAGSALPDCTAGSLQLTLRNTKNSYAPGEKPKFDLIVKNTAATGCKVDFGPKGTVVTITSADSDKAVWSSKDCPKDGSAQLFQIPANTSVTHPVVWDRRTSSPTCGAATKAAGAGTYLVEVKVPGLPVKQTSIVLAKD